MRVCWFGAYDPEYPRNAVLRRGLAAAGATVDECRVDPAAPLARQAAALTAAFRRLPAPDVVVLAEFNQLHAPLAAALARRAGARLAVDFLVSLWDTAVLDRQLLRPLRPRALSRYAQDAAALRLADVVLVDSAPLVEHYAALFGPGVRRAHAVAVGAPEWAFRGAAPPRLGAGPVEILYWGSYIPLHGLEHVADAAAELAADGRFRWTFVGDGQQATAVQPRLRALGDRVRLLAPMPFTELVRLIETADVCLGAFGTSAKARLVVPNKAWQALMAGRALVTGDGPGVHAAGLRDGEHARLVPHGDGPALAAALRELTDVRTRDALGAAGRALTLRSYSSGPLGRRLAGVLATETGVRLR